MLQQRLIGERLMERTSSHPRSDAGSAPYHTVVRHLPKTQPLPRVVLCDPKRTRHHRISQVVSECGARPRWVNDVVVIRQIAPCSVCNLAIVGLGGCPSPGDESLVTIHSLRREGFKVISYEDGAEAWSLGTRCLVLLAGSSVILDSAAPEFGHVLRCALAHLLQSEAQRRSDEEKIRSHMRRFGMVGESHAITAVFQTILRVSPLSDLPILISGETGTGKELLAHAVHQLDPKRCAGPFVALNCAAISPGLAESELFGHRRGAFTGAGYDRKGLIRSAEGGVLLLDEIGELDDGLQAKLLRVIQEHRVLSIGDDREVPISVRIIAATNRNLAEMVHQRMFRADLLHRLNVLAIHIPPLRERPTDLKPLLEHFLQKHQHLGPDSPVVMSPEFIEAFTQLTLPGNARQLENLVRWVLINKSDPSPLSLRDLPVEILEQLSAQGKGPWTMPQPMNGGMDIGASLPQTEPQHIRASFTTLLDRNGWNLGRALEDCERLVFEVALQKAAGNQSQVARLLGITPRSVYNKIHKYQLQPVNKEPL
jgi:two-component system nitrogen regulation response regulator GlnG